jgi:hypothetical protein
MYLGGGILCAKSIGGKTGESKPAGLGSAQNARFVVAASRQSAAFFKK